VCDATVSSLYFILSGVLSVFLTPHCHRGASMNNENQPNENQLNNSLNRIDKSKTSSTATPTPSTQSFSLLQVYKYEYNMTNFEQPMFVCPAASTKCHHHFCATKKGLVSFLVYFVQYRVNDFFFNFFFFNWLS